MTDPLIKESLLKAKPFQYVNLQELDLLIPYSKIVTFSANECILQQGKKGPGIYIILEGRAFKSAKILGKGEIKLSTLDQGDFIGEETFTSNDVSSATVVAETTMRCLLMTNEYLDTLAMFLPAVRHKILCSIIETTCIKLKDLTERIQESMGVTGMLHWMNLEKIIMALDGPKLVSFEEMGLDYPALQTMRIFDTLTELELEEFLRYMDLVVVENQVTLVEPGKESSFYIVVRGAVEAGIMQDKKHAKLTVLGPDCVIAGNAFIKDYLLDITYSTCETSVLLEMTQERFDLLRQNDILLWYRFYAALFKSVTRMAGAAEKLFIRLNSETYNQ